MFLRLAAAALILTLPLAGQRFHTYVGSLSDTSVTLAWGTTEGSNTIGRSSPPHGVATLHIGGRSVEVAGKNWTTVDGLDADTNYPYKIQLNGRTIGAGQLRTWATRSDRVCFFVIGDFGTGRKGQQTLAKVMAAEFEKRRASDNPVRFVLTTGDNIYGRRIFAYQVATGASDKRWGKTFFEPYGPVLGEVPFFMTLGNHDGNESEARGDLAAQLDNFFFPGGEPARWYHFNYAGLADFFALDTTTNSEAGPEAPAYLPGAEQFRWLREKIAAATAPWKIAYYHHPPFSAGPRHPGRLEKQQHIHDLCVEHGVQAVFNGHEHNLQFTDPDATGGIQYVVTGSGGELRRGSTSREARETEQIAGWAPQHQFLAVEIVDETMTITPIGYEPLRPVDPNGEPAVIPVKVER